MIGHTLAIYSGKEHFPILVSDQMVGYLCLIYLIYLLILFVFLICF